MIKRIVHTIFLLCMYELGKFLMNSFLIWWQSDDAVDLAPIDFVDGDHEHLNKVFRPEVSD
ncbi:transcriptional activator RinB [Staphylococcus simiae]|uniref:Uncharacterized protein n=1 Tax=Staphylococcus simiae CCM 7213 = CCUG 51256 TaxID=911238 RepID=G5JH76_9STAP|nr:hypothetical protein [Staphylococcus simiae]EHJ08424.1 hypothetical protein SS7213T_04025 [Staphylococcus simiae CCM 7213 = CCUG 51256]PNZ12621.1 transcriptional regulator [Staphylococcus simiae]SNV67221.1 transcriptional activator RinB [Staphylococcus simiae]